MATVTGTIRDPAGNLYANATIIASFIGLNTTPGAGPYVTGGVPQGQFETIVPGETDSTGAFSLTLAGNDTITPTPSTWRWTVVSNTTPPISFAVNIAINGASQDISAALQAAAAPLNPALAGLVLLNPLVTQAVVQPAGTSLNINRFENIRFADQFAAGSSTGGLQEAINDLPASPAGGTIIIPPNYTATIAAGTTLNVNKANIEIRGFGQTSVIAIGTGLDAINVTGDFFNLVDVKVNYTLTTTRTGKSLILMNANAANIRDVVIVGNGSSPNNGSLFTENGTFGDWTFTNVLLQEVPAFFESFISVTNGDPNISAASYFFYNVVGGAKFLSPAILLNGAIDTFQWNGGGLDGLPGTTAQMVWTKNTVGAGFDPRWVHFNGISLEGGGVASTLTAVQLDNVRDFQYFGYMTGAQTGFAIGATAKGVNIHDTVFAAILHEAITVAAGSVFTNIHNNYFDDTGDGANNSFDTISVAANAGGMSITSNTWRNLSAVNLPRYGVNILAGTGSSITVSGNMSTAPDHAFGTGFLNYGATGNNNNIQDSAANVTGVWSFNNNQIVRSAGSNTELFSFAVHRYIRDFILGWSSNSTDVNANIADTNISRGGAGIVQVGTGETANALGKIQAAVYIPSGSTSQRSESAADTNLLTITPVAVAGKYRVSFSLDVSAANAAVLGWTITYKDSNGNAVAPTNLSLKQIGTAAPALTFTTSAVSNYSGSEDITIDASATNIVVKFTLTAGTITAKASATVERLI